MESLLGYSKEPEIEPEMAPYRAALQNPKYKPDARVQGGQMIYYTWPGDMNKDGKIDPGEGQDVDQFTFWAWYYDAQMKLVEAKMKPYKEWQARMEEEIDMVEKRIQERAQNYANQSAEVVEARSLYARLKTRYDRGIGAEFYPGDVLEKELKAQMAAAEAKITQLQDYEAFVYADTLTDILNPAAGPQAYADVRVLIAKYNDYAGRYGKEADRWEEKRDHNKDYYDKAMEPYNAYYHPKPQK